MKKEYRFAHVNFDERETAIRCACCDALAETDEIFVRFPMKGALYWICGGCAISSLRSNYRTILFEHGRLNGYDDGRTCSFDTECVDTLREVCTK